MYLNYPHEEVNFLFLLHGPSQLDNSSSLFLDGLRFSFFAVNGFSFSSVCLNLVLIVMDYFSDTYYMMMTAVVSSN